MTTSKSRCGPGLAGAAVLLGALAAGIIRADAAPEPALEIGNRRELLVDEFLLASKSNLELRLHSPTPREVVMVRDAAWEGSGSDFETLIQDGDKIRMYYMGAELTNADGTLMQHHPQLQGRRPTFACYAESRDGIHWTRPVVGRFEFLGSKENNIIWAAPRLDNFTPFKDTNPNCPADEHFKAMVNGPRGLHALKSADGIQWSPLQEDPLITRGKFDSQNNPFWDPARGLYWCYVRDFHGPDGKPTNDTKTGVRDILYCTSKDFRTWSEPRPLNYGDTPDDALYINGIQLYRRAPHLFVGFPARYVDRTFSEDALRSLPDPEHRRRRMKFSPRYGTVVTDAAFMSSRNGVDFKRWAEAFVRPGPQRRDNWVYGDGFVALGLLETPAEDPTGEPELTLYLHDDHWKGPTRLRRHTLRMDGFVSLQAKRPAGEFVTKPLQCARGSLSLNFATSAVGFVRLEIQDGDGRPIPGYTLADCDEIFGDSIERTVTWRNRPRLPAPDGRPLRLKVVMSDADLFSLQFND